VILGSNNSAHDIAAALWEANAASVSVIQRSSTHVVKSDSLMKFGLGPLYSEAAVAAGISTEEADLSMASLPYKPMAFNQVPIYEKIKKQDADMYARLDAAGFACDFGTDRSGLWMKYLRRGSGYYIDVGACDLVASGAIRIKSGTTIKSLTKDSVILSDDT
jgi:putative flavoprotein involved in K+ transport